jgi:hypothetical protein
MSDIHVYFVWTYEKKNHTTIIAKLWPIKFVMTTPLKVSHKTFRFHNIYFGIWKHIT